MKKLFSMCLFFFLLGDLWAELPKYSKILGVNGDINSVGSDTLNNLVALWSEDFRKIYPGVIIQIEGKGSSTAPPALIEGVSNLAPMSRAMKKEEEEKFEKKHGFFPVRVIVALDALAIFVHKDNPIKTLSLPEVDAIFSSTRKGRYPADITRWEDLKLDGRWINRFVSLYGRNSASGTYAYFKKTALFKGDYKKHVKEQPGSASVVLGIAEDKYGIGYSGIGYNTSETKIVPLSKKLNGKAFEANYNNVLSGKYPLARALYVYFIKEPNTPLKLVIKEFLKFILSERGQEIVVKDGYLPLTKEIIKQQTLLLE